LFYDLAGPLICKILHFKGKIAPYTVSASWSAMNSTLPNIDYLQLGRALNAIDVIGTQRISWLRDLQKS
jgi:hypothetical protein